MIKCTIKRPNVKSRSLAVIPMLWEQGYKVSIAFHRDFPELWKQQFKMWNPEIYDGNNIFYKYVDNWREADLRVAGFNDGAWSYLGAQSRLIDKDEPTMNFGFWDRGTFRHENGHFVYARPHEHKHPDFIKLLVKEAVIAWVKEWGWTERDARQQILTPETSKGLLIKPYDKGSNMHYGFPGKVMVDGKPRFDNDEFSTMDIAFHASLYPLKKEIENRDYKGALGVITDYKWFWFRMPKTVLQKCAVKLGLDDGGSKADISKRIKDVL